MTLDKRSKAYRESLKANKPETQEPTTMSKDEMMLQMHTQLQEMAKELKQLKAPKVNQFIEARKIYNGPTWNYNYQMWGEIPVLGYESNKIDKTKRSLQYRGKSDWVSNQMLTLQLADGTETDVEVVDYLLNVERSEKIPATPIYHETEMLNDTKRLVIGYEFQTDTERGTFTVLPTVIN